MEAFLAGYIPKKIPTATANPKAMRIDPNDMTEGQLVKVDEIFEPTIPRSIPIVPPSSDIEIDSIRN